MISCRHSVDINHGFSSDDFPLLLFKLTLAVGVLCAFLQVCAERDIVMKFKRKWDKQNNSVKLLLRKLKRHDTLVVAVAVVIALILCGGLIYISTPAVTANAKEEYAQDTKEKNEATKEKLDELQEYLEGMDKLVVENQKGLESFYNLTKDKEEYSEVSEKAFNLANSFKGMHDTLSEAQKEILSLKELLDSGEDIDENAIADRFAKISEKISKIESDYEAAKSDSKLLTDSIDKIIETVNVDNSKEISEKYESVIEKLTELDNSFESDAGNYFNELSGKFNDLNTTITNSSKETDNKINTLNESINSQKDETNNKINTLNESINSQKDETNSKINELNQNIDSKLSDISSSSNDSINGLKDYIGNEISGVNNKIDQVFQRVSEGKSLLVSTLLTYGITIDEGAAFKTISDGIAELGEQKLEGDRIIAESVETVTSDKIMAGQQVTINHNVIEGTASSDATAVADNISEGVTAYVNGELIVGTGVDTKNSYNKGYSDGKKSVTISYSLSMGDDATEFGGDINERWALGTCDLCGQSFFEKSANSKWDPDAHVKSHLLDHFQKYHCK